MADLISYEHVLVLQTGSSDQEVFFETSEYLQKKMTMLQNTFFIEQLTIDAVFLWQLLECVEINDIPIGNTSQSKPAAYRKQSNELQSK